jgi:hypothetical protein
MSEAWKYGVRNKHIWSGKEMMSPSPPPLRGVSTVPLRARVITPLVRKSGLHDPG